LGIVEEVKADMVVMGTHGRRNIERLILGSTTEAMLRKLPVPILTVSRIDPAREIHQPHPIPMCMQRTTPIAQRLVFITQRKSRALLAPSLPCST
jgi:hypothetical protein